MIQIFDQRGVDAFSTLAYDINPLDESIYINVLEVVDNEGKVITRGDPNNYYMLDLASDEKATLSQRLNIPVPGLRPGTTLHVRLTRQSRRSVDVIRSEEVFASRSFPVVQSALFLDGEVAQVKAIAGNGFDRIDTTRGMGWRMINPPRLTNEPLLPPAAEFLPFVSFGDGTSTWASEGTEYLELIESRLNPDPSIRAVLDSLELKGRSPHEQLRAIVRFVQSSFTYKAIAFGPKAYIPNEPHQVIKNRYGDCKDQALVVHLLLREAGIDSALALVRAEGQIRPEIASIEQFDHMIVHVPSCDGEWWIDTTSHDVVAMEPTPTPSLQGRRALVLKPGKPELVALREWDDSTSGITSTRDIVVAEDGTFDVSERCVFRGSIGGYLRSALRNTEDERRGELAASLLGLESSSLRHWSLQIKSLDDVWAPIEFELRYSPHQRLRRAAGRLVGELPTVIEQEWLLPRTLQKRTHPFQQIWGLHYDVTVNLCLPPGRYVEEFSGSALDQQTPYGKVSLSFTRNDAEGRITGRLSVMATRGRFAAQEYDTFCRSRRDWVDAWTIPLVLGRNPAGK
jgi:Transglutaminase-like superfamily